MSRRATWAGTSILLLAVIGLAVLAWVFVRDGDREDRASAYEPSPLQLVLREIRDDGTWSKETALRAFAAAFGPLPGVDVPEGAEPESEFGGLPLRMLAAYFDEISPEQQAAATELAGSLAYALTGEPVDASTAGISPIAFTSNHFEMRVQELVPVIEGLIGRPLGLPVEVIVEPVQVSKFHAQAAPIFLEGPDGPLPFHACRIHVYPLSHNENETNLTAILAHELWHCFQYSRLGHPDRRLGIAPWIMEGQAMWVGEAVAGGADVPDKTVRYWTDYLVDPGPGRTLFARSYDAIGFYSHLHDTGTDPWSVLDAMLDASASNLAALEAALGTQQDGLDVITTWGAGWFRDAAPTTTFALLNAPGIPGVEIRPVPQLFTVAVGEVRSVPAGPLSASVAEVDVQAEILSIDVTGTALVGDMVFPRDIPFRDIFDAETGVWAQGSARDFCVLEQCVCPDGTPGPIERIGHQLRLGVTGDWVGGSTADLRGWSLEDWCNEQGPEDDGDGGESACGPGCASSNGDPHLTTVDGHAYDFQAVGEFTLLRSPDGRLEVQARQEPYEDSRSVSINTAVAIGAGPDRIGIYATPDGIVLLVNGQRPAQEGPVTVGRLRATVVTDGVRVETVDGTQIRVLGQGKWGLNVIVAPSDDLRASGEGLLGVVGEGELPRVRDGSAIRIEDNGHAAVYDTLASSWEVTEASTLFDYDQGAGPETYRDRSLPEPGTPLSFAELSAALQQAGLGVCAPIEDPALREQCAFDVAVTDDSGFVETYTATEAALVQDDSTPDPAPTEPAGAVLTDVALVEGAALGDDGVLYLSVTFEDRHAEVIAVDPVDSSALRRVDTMGGGQVAYAAGALWVGEQQGGDCAIVRLIPETLAEEARVDADCDFGIIPPQFVAFDGAIWFHDTAASEGARLRRIDPTSDQPAESVDLPFRNGFLQSSGSVALFSDAGEGVYRLLPGAAEFERIGSDHGIVFPGGDGFWEEDDGELRFYDRPGAPSYTTRVDDADLVGVVGQTALMERNLGSGSELWAYPRSGGAPQSLATAPSVGAGDQQRTLDYFGQQVAAGSDGVAVIWLTDGSRGSDDGAVHVQWIRVP